MLLLAWHGDTEGGAGFFVWLYALMKAGLQGRLVGLWAGLMVATKAAISFVR